MNIEGSIARTTVSDAVYRRLRDQILGSGAEAGAPLPSERTLSESFGVNRHAVREAIKRLQQAGLVVVVHGGATRITDWRREGGPELLTAIGSGADSAGRAELAAQITASRAAVARLIVGSAAEEESIGTGATAALDVAEGDERVRAYRELWRDIADACGNLAAQLSLNSLDAGLDGLGPEGAAVFASEAARAEEITSLVGAIAAGDPAAARSAAANLLAGATVQA